MTSAKEPANILPEMEERGLVAQLAGSPVALGEHLASAVRTLYCGFDPTADSLHVGSLVPLLALRRMQGAGHRPIALLGGATGLIGDPSFRADERRLSDPDEVRARIARLRAQIARLAPPQDGLRDIEIVDNATWLDQRPLLAFLRDVGKHFSVNAMVRKDAVRERLERDGAGMSFTEFSYSLLQALDYAELHRRAGCSLQLGGSDQWGNITGGIDLVRRQSGEAVYGLTLPLLTGSDGSKFGKTARGAVWLDAERTSPYAFYQFWVNTADADAERLLRWCTMLELEEIAGLAAADAAAPGRRRRHQALAESVTAWVHGESGLRAARRISEALFSERLPSLSAADMRQLERDGMPCTELLGESLSLVEALVQSGLARTPLGAVTAGQARKLIASRAVRVNDVLVTDVAHALTKRAALNGRYHVLRRGKKQFHMLCWAA